MAIYLVVTPFFPSPETWRGAYCYDFVQALMRTETYDVRVFVPGCGQDYDYQGVHVYRFRERMLPSAVLPFLFAKWNQRSFLKKVATVGIDLKNVAVCHGHTAVFGVYPLAVKRQNPDCKALLHHHDPASFGLNNGRLRHFWPHKIINFFLLRRLHEAMDLHVFISEVVRQSFLSVPDASWTGYEEYKRQMRGLGWFRSPRIHAGVILYNGVETRIFHPAPSVKPADFVIGCVGNFNEGKGQLELLRAVARVRRDFPRVRVRFVGSGESLPTCRAFVEEQCLAVEFYEEMDHTRLPDFYRGLDLFVLPSWWDGFGCVFSEAWACGIPFLACSQIGIAELVPEPERETWLFPSHDVDVLTMRIHAFFTLRPVQHLHLPIDCDSLTTTFLRQVEMTGRGV